MCLLRWFSCCWRRVVVYLEREGRKCKNPAAAACMIDKKNSSTAQYTARNSPQWFFTIEGDFPESSWKWEKIATLSPPHTTHYAPLRVLWLWDQREHFSLFLCVCEYCAALVFTHTHKHTYSALAVVGICEFVTWNVRIEVVCMCGFECKLL